MILSAELRHWRDRKRHDEQDIADACEIVELYQSEPACRVSRRQPDANWTFEAIGGNDAILRLTSVGLEIPLEEICKFISFDDVAETPGFA